RPDPRMPDAVWMRPSVVRSFTHEVAGSTPPTTAQPPAPPVPDSYAAAFARVQEELRHGNTFELNLSHRVTATSPLTPAQAYARLRRLNPAPYAGFLQHDVDDARGWLLSSSPERYALVTADRTCETKPIKGTTSRGASAVEDEESRRLLASDPRFRAENL